ncbi:MAG: PilW family protein [Archangium sp.]
MSRRGMTLIELMIATAMGIIVIAGLVGTTLAFQAMGFQQQQRMAAQQSLRSASDLLTLRLQEAGSGLGNVRINLGQGQERSAIDVVTNDLFVTDTTFAAAAAPYASASSDSITIFSGRTEGLRSTACCGGGGGACGTCTIRSSGETCMAFSPVGTVAQTDEVAYVNTTLGVACAQMVSAAPTPTRLATTGGVAGFSVPLSTDPCGANGQIWCSANTWVMPLDAVSFRVNWKPVNASSPQRPRLQMDPDGPLGPQGWTDVLWDVERMQIRLQVADLTNTGVGLFFADAGAPGGVFFPDAAAGRPALDVCTAATPGCTVPGVLDLKDSAISSLLSVDQALRAQLRRRVRGVEITLIARSQSADRELIRYQSPNVYALDANGLPMDGLSRRRLVFHVTPRNYGLTEAP